MTDLAPAIDDGPIADPVTAVVVEPAAEPPTVDGYVCPDPHITYHPIAPDLIERYAYYVFGEGGADVAAAHCEAVSMDEAHASHFLSLLEGFASPGDFAFDQTHGFSIAVMQGFFGRYYYTHGASLSGLGSVIEPYVTPWKEILGGWAGVDTAENRVLSRFSSGVFIAAPDITRLMNDAHSNAVLAEALGAHFDARTMPVLWSALQAAQEQGAGLLEAAGIIVPDAADMNASVCMAHYANCDTAGLEAFVAAAASPEAPMPASPPNAAVPAVADLPVPRHMQVDHVPSAGERLPGTPSLTERLKAKRSAGY